MVRVGDGRRGRRWALRSAVVVLALLLAAPLARGVLWDQTRGPWGARAEEWAAQFLLVTGQTESAGVASAFYAAGTGIDVRPQAGVDMDLATALRPRGSGRYPASMIEGVRRQGVYVGGSGVVLLLGAPRVHPFVRTPFVTQWGEVSELRQGRPPHYAVVLDLARDGITRHTELAAVDTWGEAPRQCDEVAVARLRAAYSAVWSDGDSTAAATLYSPDAVLTDAATGRRVEGAAGIARSAARTGEGVRPTLLTLRGAAGEAVYVTCDPLEAPDEMAVLLQRLDRLGCPVEYVADLRLDRDGRVVGEEWFTSPQSARRCLADAPADEGVWTDVAVPKPLAAEVEGRLERHDQVVTLVDSEPALVDQLEWALRRYEEAGLRAPVVRRVTWVDRRDSACEVVNGQAMSRRTEGFEVTLCFDRADACRDTACTRTEPWTRTVLLHELAHVWLAQNTDSGVEADFLEHTRLRHWNRPETPYHLRGVERACWDIAYGLMDEPRPEPPGDPATCAWYDDGFRLLTGIDPLTPACA